MTNISTTLANPQADNAAAILAAATLTFFSGPVPASADAALVAANNALAIHALTGFDGSAVAGSVEANPIDDVQITGAGTQTATFARAVASGVTPIVVQLTVGVDPATNPDLLVSTTEFINGGTSSITSLTLVQPTG